MDFYIYLILAVVFFICELFSMEFSLACLGVGTLGAALASWLGWNIWGQVFAFAAVAAVCWIGIRPLALKLLYGKSKKVKTPAEDVIGQEAVVETAIDPVEGVGRVKVAGESWKATSAQALAKGTVCIVEKLDGVTLTVRAKK